VEQGIGLHTIPFSEAKKRQRRWVNFIKAKQGGATLNGFAHSRHFIPDDLDQRFFSQPGQNSASEAKHQGVNFHVNSQFVFEFF